METNGTLVIPKRERKTSSLTMYIEPSLLDQVNELATVQGVTRSEAVRFVLALFFAEHSKKFGVNKEAMQIEPQ